ncbi:MAG: FAD-dependent oxidoreductase [Alphaproteobacteria bacterium]
MGARLATACCICGGGPAGMMLGLLLARAGVDVIVLEKHADFLRDFRGDTIHPSTLEVLHELDMLDAFLAEPHQKVHRVAGVVGGIATPIADFSRLPVRCRFIAFVPQWNFLDFIARQGARYPAFHLRMACAAVGLAVRDGRVAGVRARAADGGTLDIDADLVVAADGRESRLRAEAGLSVRDIGAPIDALWFKLPRRAADPPGVMGRFDAGRVMVTLDRGDYWQCAYIIPKGGFERLREAGLPAFHAGVAAIAPDLADRVGDVRSWDDVSLLRVRVDRLRTWHRPGLLCLGDAAHAMSPLGGVGINLAIQDAVAAANILAQPLRRGTVAASHLHAVQRRRMWPTRATQALQVAAQNRLLRPMLEATTRPGPPLPLRLLRRSAWLRRLMGRLIGLGFRPEHVATPVAGVPPTG